MSNVNRSYPTVAQLIIIGAYLLVALIPAALLGWINWGTYIVIGTIWIIVDFIHGYYKIRWGDGNTRTIGVLGRE